MTTLRRPGKNVVQYRFSLVEILVVVGIIAILLGLSGAGYTAVQRKIARTRTEATLNKLRVGLESFKSKYGYYPQQTTVAPFPFYIVKTSTQTISGVKSTVNSDAYFEPKYSFAQFTEASKMKNEDAIKIPITSPDGVLGPAVSGGVTYNLTYDLYYITDSWKTNIKVPPSGADYVDPDPVYSTYSTKSGPYILYVCPGLVNTSSYDLFSAGNDRKFIWRDTPATQIDTDKNDPVNTDNIWPQGLKTK